jgi:hypothetical protein
VAGQKNPKHRQQWENTLKTYASPRARCAAGGGNRHRPGDKVARNFLAAVQLVALIAYWIN